MNKLNIETLENYLKETYKSFDEDQGLFMKLVEEIGEVAELLNIRTGRKGGDKDIKEELAKELADVIHYTVAIAAINNIDLEKTIIEKDLKAAIKYNHEINLKDYMERKS
ncbi:MazG nucleotide pyrophosphohydrolase domain-containing protein [Roseburia sp. 499]|uniref:MazG nucleotide pyrophosphohydrolase domain-containing protein n=1 Tax=Roseburia sp. 499 TaxID=1261634 RepID=UPI000952A25B|nr:MazG nucleotide pyrophosphohydrolase domain-containing protein [Roseburia sp. 499]WVK71322.1 MazG nucleotide pyrophosphohydrolase domain-containing protein [Roseburia sp. 499]